MYDKKIVRTLFVLVFTFLYLAMQEVQANENVDIKITLNGYQSGWCKLVGIYGDQNYLVDSFPTNLNGLVFIKKDSLYPQGLYYLLLPDYKNISFLLDEVQNFEITFDRNSPVHSLNTKQSLSNQLYFQSIKIQEKIDSIQKVLKTNPINSVELRNNLQSLFAERSAQVDYCRINYPQNFYTLYKLSGQNPSFPEILKPNGDLDTFAQLNRYRNEFWANVDFNDVRLLRTPVIANKLRRHIKELTPQQPDSIIAQADILIQQSRVNRDMFAFISNWIALQYQPTKTTVMDGEAVYVHVIDTYFDETSDWYQPGELEKLKKKTGEMKASLLYKKGPDVVSTDPYGKKRSIYEISKPYIVIYMYSPNCEHCKKETPKLKAFYDEWKNKGVEVYAIVLETNHDEWNNYIQNNSIGEWINVFDPTNASIYAKYYVDITPEIYVLNPERIIIGKNLKTEQIQIIIDKDLKKRN
ncbi:MAG: thioredoxin-like domain-containing protein [Saprospiraceae bacterium]